MPFEKAKVALAALEEKLRRQLGLAGDIGAQFTPALTPVIIAGDLREAGNAANKGRAFAWSYNGPIGAGFGTFMSVRTEQDIRIDTLILGNNAALQVCRCYITVPGQAPAVAVTTLAGSWQDRKDVSTDQVPLTQGVPGALTGTAETDQNRLYSAALASATLVIPVNVMLPAGSCLNFTSGGAGMIAGFAGRIWP